MLSFVMVMSLYPTSAPKTFESIEDAVIPQTELLAPDTVREIGSVAKSTPMPPTGKLSAIVLESNAESVSPTRESVRLVFGGDVNGGRWGDKPDWHPSLVESFVNLLPLLQGSDLVFFNAEGGLCDPFEASVELKPRGSNVLWVTPASLIDLQAELGETALIIGQANNHTLNLGEACMHFGTTQLAEAGIDILGAGEDLAAARVPYIFERNGTTIGILGYADTNVIIDAWVANADHSGVVPMDVDILAEDMQALRPDVDFLIVTMHSGKEFEQAVTDHQVQFAMAAVQYGADLVIGHGAHVPQGVLQVDDTPIYFGLGNGMMDQCFSQDYAFYSNDVRKNVWLEVEIRQSELISIQDHVFYSEECMVPSAASTGIQVEVSHAFEHILFMGDWPILSDLGINDFVKDAAYDDFVD